MSTFPGSGETSLLEFCSTVIVPGTKATFFARDNFVINTTHRDKVSICRLGREFSQRFLELGGKIDAPIDQTALCCFQLKVESIDTPIITELGGETKAETKLTHIFSLMKKQPHGEKGPLFVKKGDSAASGNIFYVRDTRGELCDVLVAWQSEGWVVCAMDTTSLRTRWNEWELGNHVFSLAPNPFVMPRHATL